MSSISDTATITRIRLQEQASAPSSPASGYGYIYVKNDGKFYFKNDAGTETEMGAYAGGTLTAALNEAPIVTIASAATVNIGAAAANTISISGTTTITAFDTIASGARRLVHFQGALTLTHNATSLILPTGANITTAAGDVAEFVSLGSGNWRCVAYMRASGAALSGGGGGGLTNWTDAVNTAAPNATVPVTSLTATNAATNVDAAVVPKGTGAFALNIANNLASGGNKRGSQAVDLQLIRSANTQVASGAYSFAAGYGNTVSGQRSACVGGLTNSATQTDCGTFAGTNGTASANYAVTLGGASNTASGTAAACVGGGSGAGNTASGENSAVIGSKGCTASATEAVAIAAQNATANGIMCMVGGYYGTARGIKGVRVWGAGFASVAGDYQVRDFVMRTSTANNTATSMTTDGSAKGASNIINVASGKACRIKGQIIAYEVATGDVKCWDVDAAAKNIGGTTSLVGAATVTAAQASAGAAAWTVAITADDTNDCVDIQCTGENTKTIRWSASINCVEIG